jgi:hypothetical protein
MTIGVRRAVKRPRILHLYRMRAGSLPEVTFQPAEFPK